MDSPEIADGIFFDPHSSPGILSRDRTEDHIFRAAAEGRTFHKYTHVLEAQKRIEKPLDGEKVQEIAKGHAISCLCSGFANGDGPRICTNNVCMYWYEQCTTRVAQKVRTRKISISEFSGRHFLSGFGRTKFLNNVYCLETSCVSEFLLSYAHHKAKTDLN